MAPSNKGRSFGYLWELFTLQVDKNYNISHFVSRMSEWAGAILSNTSVDFVKCNGKWIYDNISGI